MKHKRGHDPRCRTCLDRKAERYAKSAITYTSRTGTSTGEVDRLPVAEAFRVGYRAGLRAASQEVQR